ncbi:MAG: carboxypeptidase-like regulatory domain-containing protein [Planctomycetes bacterium]|nr:carboxypeptidase-like regulatory domain-containing protein [Planctomycetota bacterium]
MQIRHFSACAALSVLVALAGCGSGAEGEGERVDVYPVSGKITMAGGPVANAAVTFSPKENQPVANGRTDAQGNYTLTTYEAGDGAAPGEYVVLVTKSTAPADPGLGPSVDDPNYGAAPQHTAQAPAGTGSALPDKYAAADQSPLTATVKAGDNAGVDFTLKP